MQYSGLSPGEVAAALEAAAATADLVAAENAVDLVWTGPKAKSVTVRRMEQSLCELIGSARKNLLAVRFVAYRADKVYAAIRAAIGRGVRVSFLTESSKGHGGTLEIDPADMFREKFHEADFYRWEIPDAAHPAVVHAKCSIADGCKALVPSANLAGAAMDDNMELGLLVSSRRIVGRMADHFAALVAEHVPGKI